MISRNKKVNREFELLEKYEAGIVLSGSEVKSVKTRGIQLESAYVKIMGGGVHLLSAVIQPYQFSRRDDEYDPARTRKLLLNKREILKLQNKLSQGNRLTIVPVSCYNKGSLIKIEIAIAKGKRDWQKKRVEQKKTEKRTAEKEMKKAMMK